MTHRIDVTCGHLLAARWHTLAEQRLEHLTELFESGRWRRYYSERAFLENIQEAKAAVALWRDLSMPQAVETAKPNGAAMVQAAPIIVQAKAVVDLTGAASEATSDEMLPAPAATPS